ncbi:hypothetical protein FA13DRAFT_1716669 [Coprinellus micaceus]|uniref:F-box domain-containing protein n=1 Tax=Coprinellus micaceus TaxID=71717 RepID=A0A4Y7SIS0_COPMI|nr:hypothetical protein FA13DRAFT_1716669 [Coprinellus micaceus]
MDHQSPFAQHLEANFIPTSAEIEAISNLLDEQQQHVDAIDAEITSLQQRRRVHTDYMGKHRCLIAAVRRIPADILTTITRALIAASNGRPRVILRSWRELTIESPPLWADIDLDIPSYPAKSPQGFVVDDARAPSWERTLEGISCRTEIFAQRANNSGLRISFIAKDPPFDILRRWVMYHHRGVWDKILQPFIRLASMTNRWQSLAIRLHPFTPMSPLLEILKLVEGVTSCTKELKVEIMCEFPLGEEMWRKMLSEGAMPIRRAPLTSFNAKMAYSDLCRFQPNWGALSRLSIGSPDHIIVFQEAASVLAVTPNISHCTIQFSDGLREIQFVAPPHIISLPKLKSLIVRGTDIPIEFTAILDLPCLTHLPAIQNLRFHPKDENQHAVIELIRRYGGQVTDVSFVYASMTPSAFGFALDNLPNVVSLELVGEGPDSRTPKRAPLQEEWIFPAEANQLHIDVFETLIPEHEGPPYPLESCACPRLQALACKFGVHRGAGTPIKRQMLKLISARQRGLRNANEDGVSWLERVEVVFKSGKVDWMMEELRTNGVDTDDVRFSAQYPDPCLVPAFSAVRPTIPGIGQIFQMLEIERSLDDE